MSTRIGFCTVFKGRDYMRIGLDTMSCVDGVMTLNEDQARKLIEDLKTAVMIAWPEPPKKNAPEGE